MAKPENTTPPLAEAAMANELVALRGEVKALRRTQLEMFKLVVTMRHELAHRQATGREELGAFIKASHAELAERFDLLTGGFDEQTQRLLELEQDFDEVLDRHR